MPIRRLGRTPARGRRPLLAPLIAGLLATSACGETGAAEDGSLLVLAASDLQFALPEIADLYTRATGRPIRLVLGSTGGLTAQIEQGAPGDVFLSANETFVDRLVDGGRVIEGTRTVYAVGRLAIVTAPGIDPVASMAELTEERISTIAIANPEHAPYGIAAREAMSRAGVVDAVESRLVFGENVSQALQFVRSGNADAGIVAVGVVAGDAERPYAPVPADLHEPLRQAAVVLRGSTDPSAAADFLDFLIDDAAAAVLRRHGFEPPDR